MRLMYSLLVKHSSFRKDTSLQRVFDQITDIEIPYGSVGGHTMIVEKIASEEPEDPTPEDPSTEDPTTPEDPAITDDPQSGDDTKADTVKDETK